MNVKDFLIDNYIWIIVIILITIITIIGFLADKKKGNKKEQAVPPVNPSTNSMQPNNMAQMQYQQPVAMTPDTSMNNNMMMNNNVVQNQFQQPNNGIMMQTNQNMINSQDINNMNQNMIQATPNMQLDQSVLTITTPVDTNMNNNTQPVEVSTQTIPQEQMYQPLSEQKPNIPPQPLPDFVNNQNITPTIPMEMPVQSIQQPVQTTIGNEIYNTNINGEMMDYNQNNGTIPNITNQIPVPQPVNPQPIMSNNMDTMNYNLEPTINSTIPMSVPMQNVQQPAPVQPVTQNVINQNMGMNYNDGFNQQQPMNGTMPQNNVNQQPLPVNFVFGPQNNNQNM